MACPENKAQFLFDRARVLGTWAKYSDSQIGRIDRAIEDFRVDKDRLPAIYQLQSDLEDQRDARAKQAKAAYDAFYAAKAETGSHLDFKLGDKQTYIDIQGWAKN